MMNPAETHLSILSLSFNKNLSLSSSAIFTSLSRRLFLSDNSNCLVSTSSAFPSTWLTTLLLVHALARSLSIATHLRVSSSSSRSEVDKTPMQWLLHMSNPLTLCVSLPSIDLTQSNTSHTKLNLTPCLLEHKSAFFSLI